jgi:hypothetical protein
VAAELGESASEVIRKAIHLAWVAAMQDRMCREPRLTLARLTEVADLLKLKVHGTPPTVVRVARHG